MRTPRTIDQAQFFALLDQRLTQADKTLEPTEYIVSDERQLVYVVNSKVACSSIKSAFLDAPTPDDHSIHRTMIQKGLYCYHLSEEQTHYFSFSFVRNPFSRLVSSYESKYHIDPEKYGFSEYEHYLFGYLSEDAGFEDYVRKVCALPPRLMNRHFRPQYDVLYDKNGVCRCDYIGRFESIEEDFRPIRERFGLQPLPHLNQSKAVDWRDYYTHETLALVRETFRRDFEVFGYADNGEN